jgi:hypothetical protein
LAAASARVASAKLSKWAIGTTLSEFVSMVASPPHRMRPFSVFPGTGFSTFLAESRLTLRVSRFYPPQAAFLLILHPASIDRDVLSGFSRHWPGHPSYYDEVADHSNGSGVSPGFLLLTANLLLPAAATLLVFEGLS